MRFVKQQQINKKMIVDKSVFVDVFGAVSFSGSKAGLRLGAGNTLERGSSPVNGTIRYNSETNEMEAYINNAWESIRTDRPADIQVQNLGTGDANITEFGPLSPVPVAAENVIVLVENVFQIAGVNYTLVNTAGNWNIKFDSPVPLGKDVTVLHGFDGSILG
tara:strand:+ start:1679 stop:2164 length:486 start_codon:yes stop_codon:yes gene_type:complete